MSCVFPGLDEVFAKCLVLQSVLIKDDFPTLDRPIKAYSGKLTLGHFATFVLLITNLAERIRIGSELKVMLF